MYGVERQALDIYLQATIVVDNEIFRGERLKKSDCKLTCLQHRTKKHAL